MPLNIEEAYELLKEKSEDGKISCRDLARICNISIRNLIKYAEKRDLLNNSGKNKDFDIETARKIISLSKPNITGISWRDFMGLYSLGYRRLGELYEEKKIEKMHGFDERTYVLPEQIPKIIQKPIVCVTLNKNVLFIADNGNIKAYTYVAYSPDHAVTFNDRLYIPENNNKLQKKDYNNGISLTNKEYDEEISKVVKHLEENKPWFGYVWSKIFECAKNYANKEEILNFDKTLTNITEKEPVSRTRVDAFLAVQLSNTGFMKDFEFMFWTAKSRDIYNLETFERIGNIYNLPSIKVYNILSTNWRLSQDVKNKSIDLCFR